MHLQLMEKLNSTYAELQDTPAIIIQDALLALAAEGQAAKTRERWSQR